MHFEYKFTQTKRSLKTLTKFLSILLCAGMLLGSDLSVYAASPLINLSMAEPAPLPAEPVPAEPEPAPAAPVLNEAFGTIGSCTIGGGNVNVSVSMPSIPATDDDLFYLFALKPYQDSIPSNGQPVAQIGKALQFQVGTPLNHNSAGTHLYDKFAIAVRSGGKFVMITTPKYITNPEAVASHPNVYQQARSKKGLLIDPDRLNTGELEDLGVSQASYNIMLGTIMGPTTNAAYPTIEYNYNGKVYQFNGLTVAQLDIVFGSFANKGIQATGIVLNDYNKSYPQIIHPKARRKGAAPYYMFNCADQDGIDAMAAAATFLAKRYNGTGHGRISNWIIANEIGARAEWNYYPNVDVATYSHVYAEGFRVWYNAIKSVSGDAKIFMSLDNRWAGNLSGGADYDSRDVLTHFNAYIASHGNIDWNIAFHPYNYPLKKVDVWNANENINHTFDTRAVSMANIDVLINYIHQPGYQNPKGGSRLIILSEQGYTSNQGEELQAAAFVYAYYKTRQYGEIVGFLMHRQSDAQAEVRQGLALGLNGLDGHRKLIYDVFKYCDTDQWAAHSEFAKPIMGISDWSEIMTKP